MLVKAILIFLAAMVLVGMIGNLLFPGVLSRRVKGKTLSRPATCPNCGRYVIGKSGCDCRKKG